MRIMMPVRVGCVVFKQREIDMGELLNCKCGLSVEIDYGMCTEFYGKTWQDVSVMCGGNCGYSVDITFNADVAGESALAATQVIVAWNTQQSTLLKF